MKREYFKTALFFLIIAVFFYLFYRLMIPFFQPIAWAAIMVIVFYPLYNILLAKLKKKWLASALSSLIVFILIIGPALYILASLVDEAAQLLDFLNRAQEQGISPLKTLNIPFIDSLKEKLAHYPQLAQIDFENIAKDAASAVAKAIGSQATKVIANISRTILYFFLMLFVMFFFFRDGDRIIAFLKRITPLTPDQVNATYTQLRDVIEGTMYGGVAIALMQGILGGILFALVGIDSPILWGAVMAFLALLPVIGPFLVYIPAGIILLLGGHTVKGIVVIAIGVGISQIDNFVRPYLFRNKTAMHTLLLFFSIMGGMVLFGLLGVVLGPIISAVFVVILRLFEGSLNPESPN